MELQQARLKVVKSKGSFDYKGYITQLFEDVTEIEESYHHLGAKSIFERLGFQAVSGAEDCYNQSLKTFVGDDSDVLSHETDNKESDIQFIRNTLMSFLIYPLVKEGVKMDQSTKDLVDIMTKSLKIMSSDESIHQPYISAYNFI